MQDLTPVGLSKDGKHLVLLSDAGEEFRVAVDQRLRTALRGDHARLGQLEMTMDSALRPRDIQSRIRAGESADDVAAAAGTTVDGIMVYAGPVLAERAHVAETARKASIRRRVQDAGAARTLEESARTHLGSIGVRDHEVEWDAWRRDDGRWTLTASYGTSVAEFTFDQPGRYVVADNDEARLLTGEIATPVQPGEAPRRRLTPVSDDELPLGDDAIELVREPADDPAADHADADWIATVPAPTTDDADEAGAVDEETTAARDEELAEHQEALGDADETDESDEGEARHRKRKGRSSVPSWDEIMFGSGSSE